MRYIIGFNEKDIKLKNKAGGKGKSLINLSNINLPVPKGYVVLCHAFTDGDICSEAIDELENLINRLSDNITYAVRSSAISEDGEEASFAGAYETILDVSRNSVIYAVKKVVDSKKSLRVSEYAKNKGIAKSDIAVVIQEFIKPDLAGVLFTSNPVTRDRSEMVGNYVYGVGESLVSGEKNANEFIINSLNFSYSGNIELKKYAKKLFKYAKKIREYYKSEQDIEWAISNGKVYILQARPITTLRRVNLDNYDINSSLSGKYLFCNTNVGEALPKVLSPMLFSLTEIINNAIGLPQFLDNICGHPYANMSVIYSALKSFKLSNKTIKKITSDIAGEIPNEIKVPIFPYNRRQMIKNIFKLVRGNKNNIYKKIDSDYFFNNANYIMFDIFKKIDDTSNNKQLKEVYEKYVVSFRDKLIKTMIKNGKIGGLFAFRSELENMVSIECANAICSNFGEEELESIKPSLYIEKVISGEISKEDYLKLYGHRSPDELEVSKPYPYEIEGYLDNLINEYKSNNISISEMRKKQKENFEKAKKEFYDKYPNKIKWFNKKLIKFQQAEINREKIRSKGVLLVCITRKFLLRFGELNNIFDDVFYLYYDEVLNKLYGNEINFANITKRKEKYNEYLELPTLPTVIFGRIDPYKWSENENRNIELYIERRDEYNNIKISEDNCIKGFAGASGIIKGRVRVLTDFSKADEFQKGEILVTTMTNIGWTPIFPKVSAIITDIGAPLSHAAIVAREFGIPSVVGCKNATQLLKTGDMVIVDGGKGIVTKIEDNPIDIKDNKC